MNRHTSLSILACLLGAFPAALVAKTDNIDIPFADDPTVVGRWRSVAYIDATEEFSAGKPPTSDLFFKGLEFQTGGGTDWGVHTWTKHFVLSASMKTASKYVIKNLGGMDYMFMEWKSGDYTIRDRDPGHYVLVREKDYARLPQARVPAGPGRASARKQTWDCLNLKPDSGICRRPAPFVFRRPVLKELPAFDENSGRHWQVDLRGMDLSSLDLSGRLADLLYADFDSLTKFPAALPKEFSPAKIMELGQNPGLGIRALHLQGLTGKGVAVAIIDQPLITSHREYADSLKSYEELRMPGSAQERPAAAMHGAAVASIAVGKTCGVAPGADLYYIATDFQDDEERLRNVAAAIDRLLTVNEKLPKERRIRAISISRGFRKNDPGAAELLASIGKAKRRGVLVMTTSPEEYYDFGFNGLGRDPLKDPDDRASYSPGLFWQKAFFSGRFAMPQLLVPMDSRTTASPTGDNDYVFYREGGMSWSVPYIVGLYALACQAVPETTPEAFLKKVVATAAIVKMKKRDREFSLGGIVDPAKLIR